MKPIIRLGLGTVTLFLAAGLFFPGTVSAQVFTNATKLRGEALCNPLTNTVDGVALVWSVSNKCWAAQSSPGTGPTGPAGATGSTGSAGPAGPTGPAGPSGLVVDVTAYGPDITGVADAAPQIRTAIAAVPSGGVLYFPKGTYRLASGGSAGTEECLRITTPISLVGEPGAVFIDDASPVCTGMVGYFYNGTADYSYEADTGYLVTASTATIGAGTLTLATVSNASLYAAGQWVYLRGTSIGGGEYHGELNQITTAGNGSTGVVTLMWPLSSNFAGDSGLQLNLVASSEILQNVSISGITFNTHSQAILAAQLLNLKVYNNVFNYGGSTTGTDMFQFNQERSAQFYGNVVNNPLGSAIDPARNPTGWNIHDNTLYGTAGFGEMGAGDSFNHNTQYCTNATTTPCTDLGGITGGSIDGNVISASGGGSSAVIYDSYGAASQGSKINNNLVIASGLPAIRAGSYGTQVSNNEIYSSGTGIDLQNGGIGAFANIVSLTTTGNYGCALVEGSDHSDIISGLQCSSTSGVTGSRGVWVSDNGAQTSAALQITGLIAQGLSEGIHVVNASHDIPIITAFGYASVSTPFVNCGITAGSYTSTNLTVDATGRITAIANGSGGGGGTPAGVTGDLQDNSSGSFGAIHPTSSVAGYPYWTGSAWVVADIQTGGTGEIDCATVPGQCSFSYTPLLTHAYTWTGNHNFLGASKTAPNRASTGSPNARDNCANIGETYFQTDATAGSNSWGCTATGTPGTWTLQGGGGGGGGGQTLATASQGMWISGYPSGVGALTSYASLVPVFQEWPNPFASLTISSVTFWLYPTDPSHHVVVGIFDGTCTLVQQSASTALTTAGAFTVSMTTPAIVTTSALYLGILTDSTTASFKADDTSNSTVMAPMVNSGATPQIFSGPTAGSLTFGTPGSSTCGTRTALSGGLFYSATAYARP